MPHKVVRQLTVQTLNKGRAAPRRAALPLPGTCFWLLVEDDCLTCGCEELLRAVAAALTWRGRAVEEGHHVFARRHS